ncbi:MAG: hypothetical protein QM770_21475 [Tepidisphaeraceae bacterium]
MKKTLIAVCGLVLSVACWTSNARAEGLVDAKTHVTVMPPDRWKVESEPDSVVTAPDQTATVTMVVVEPDIADAALEAIGTEEGLKAHADAVNAMFVSAKKSE